MCDFRPGSHTSQLKMWCNYLCDGEKYRSELRRDSECRPTISGKFCLALMTFLQRLYKMNKWITVRLCKKHLWNLYHTETLTTPLSNKQSLLCFANVVQFPGMGKEKPFSLFKESHPPRHFCGHVEKKKKEGEGSLRNMLLDGMAGMRNGNCFPFCTVSGKGSKNKKSISVGDHSQCLSWESAINRGKSQRPILCRPLSKNSYKVGRTGLVNSVSWLWSPSQHMWKSLWSGRYLSIGESFTVEQERGLFCQFTRGSFMSMELGISGKGRPII